MRLDEDQEKEIKKNCRVLLYSHFLEEEHSMLHRATEEKH